MEATLLNSAKIFGERSILIESIGEGATSIPLLMNIPAYEYIVLATIVLYLVWIQRLISGGGLRQLFMGEDDIFELRSQNIKIGDALLSTLLILSFFIIFTTKAVEVVDTTPLSKYLSHDSLVERIESLGIMRWGGVVTLTTIFNIVWSTLILLLCNSLSGGRAIHNSIFRIKRELLMISVIWLVPFVVLCSFDYGNYVLFYITLSQVFIVTSIYLFRSFLLFKAQKISNLLWFLYLCGVEIFPITLAWALFTRS